MHKYIPIMATITTQNKTTVSLCLAFVAFSAMCHTIHCAPVCGTVPCAVPMCPWSLNYQPLPTNPAFNLTNLNLVYQAVAALYGALRSGPVCLINVRVTIPPPPPTFKNVIEKFGILNCSQMALTAAEKEAANQPHHRCYGQERTGDEMYNFNVSCSGKAFPLGILSASSAWSYRLNKG